MEVCPREGYICETRGQPVLQNVLQKWLPIGCLRHPDSSRYCMRQEACDHQPQCPQPVLQHLKRVTRVNPATHNMDLDVLPSSNLTSQWKFQPRTSAWTSLARLNQPSKCQWSFDQCTNRTLFPSLQTLLRAGAEAMSFTGFGAENSVASPAVSPQGKMS